MSRKPKAKRRRKTQSRRVRRPSQHRRKAVIPRKKVKRTQKRSHPDPLLELAVREMNRGRSLTATARSLHIKPAVLQKSLKKHRLAKRKGKRWVTKDNRLRRIPVMTDGVIHNLIVRGFDQARIAGEHTHAAKEFVRTNDIELLKPFKGRTVRAANGRQYVLETDPNALHRIAAMDSPPFHEIYAITSST